MTISSPDVSVLKTDHLDAEAALMLGMQLEMVAAEVKPELVW